MSRWRMPLFAAGAYALLGSGWILGGFALSDLLFAQDATARFELYKGLAFVAITALALYLLLRHARPVSTDAVTFGEMAREFTDSIRLGERSLRALPAGLASILVALLCLLVFGLGFLRTQVLAAGERSTGALRYAVAAQLGESLTRLDQVLATAGRDLPAQLPGEADLVLRRGVEMASPLVRAMWVLDAGGRIVLDSDTGNLGVDLSDRDYFRHHLDHAGGAMFIGNPVRSRSTGTWFISVSRALRTTPDAPGALRGVIVAALEIERFDRFFSIPPQYGEISVALFRQDATLLARSPLQPEALGKSFAHVPAWRDLVPRRPEGVYQTASSIDGETRIFAYGDVPGYPQLKLFVGNPMTALLGDWHSFALVSAGAFLTLSGLVAIMAVLLLRQMRSRIATQKRAAALARYPLHNINPVLTVSRDGTRRFANDAARDLERTLDGSPAAAAFEDAMGAFGIAPEPGVRELTLGKRILSAAYVPNEEDGCDVYLTDVTAMRHDEKMLGLFFDLPFMGMAITSPRSKRWIRCNDRLCEILGYPRHELENKTWAELTHPDDLDADVANYERVLAGFTDSYVMEKRFCRADGATVHAVIDVRAIRATDGSVEIFLATIHDVTERKHRELELMRQRNLYAALSQTNEAIIHVDERTELFARVCEVVVDTAGFSLAWIGMVDAESGDIVPVARAGANDDYVDSVHASGDANVQRGLGLAGLAVREGRHQIANDVAAHPGMQAWREALERRGIRSAGTFPLRQAAHTIGMLAVYSTEPAPFQDDIVKLLDEIANDVSFALDNLDSARRRDAAVAELRSAEARWQFALEGAEHGVWEWDLVSDRVFYSSQWKAMLGYDDDEIGDSLDEWRSRIHPDDLSEVLREIEVHRRGESTIFTCEHRLRCKDGSYRWIAARGKCMSLNGSASSQSMVGTHTDITQRHAAQQQVLDYIARLEHAMTTTVGVISDMVETRDPYTSGHERRVGDLAAAIGAELGLEANVIAGLRVAGQVHDVGKLAVPAEILAKPTRLSAPEFDLVKVHATRGYEILKNVDFPWPVAVATWQHHERMDGSGYPRGLKGEEICVEARILAVADVVESMSSHRPYRPALGIDAGLEEIELKAGTLFDADVVDACLRLFRERGYTLAG